MITERAHTMPAKYALAIAAVLALAEGVAWYVGVALAQQPQEAPRNMGAVQCKLNETALNLAAGSWARTLDIAQDQEAELVRLRAELAKVPAYPVDPNISD